MDRVAALRQHVFDEAARGDKHLVLVAELDDFADDFSGIKLKEPPANFSESV